jgi:hypothetical protein
MKSFKFYIPLCIGILLFIMSGCIAWDPGWKLAQSPAVKGDVNVLMEKAKKLSGEADSKEKLQNYIAALEEALKADPGNQKILTDLGNFCYLMAYAYCNDIAEKKKNLVKALQYNEMVMYRNPEFKALVDKGEPVWEACRVLKKENMSAIYFWYLSIGVYWNDCLGSCGKILNFFWVGRGKQVLEHMTKIDPAWGNGRIDFVWGLFYTISPGMMGGDMKKAADHFSKAIVQGPHMTNFYTARAEYFQVKQKDRKAFSGDLHHALAIDPRKADTLEYPWAVWYHVKSIEMLKDIDRYFK